MKSIILVVLLALSCSTLARPDFGLEQEGSFQAFRRAGSKATFSSTVSTEADDESAVESDADSAVDTKDLETAFDQTQKYEHINEKDGKVDCSCNKGKPKITYGQEQVVKGKPETYIHHQPKIIVRQPPTHVRIEHPPTVIQPSTIVIHRNGKTIRRPVVYQHLPQDVRVRPVIVKWVKPIIKKVIVEKKGDSYSKQGQENKPQDDEYSVSAQEQNSQQDGYSVLAEQGSSQQDGYSVITREDKHKQQDDHSLEYETQTFDGESYGAGSYGAGSYGEGSYSESFN